MDVQELFFRASEEFEDRNYEKGLSLISRCIENDSTSSLLYCNRGLFYAQLGENEAAARDLQKAIELNHLNYLAYFNLFSLQYRSGQQEIAFENLCCSLSSLYLLRAKKSRRELDVQKSISYADNNFEAYVLKSLMYLQDGRLTPALNYMQWACDLNPSNTLSKKLKNIIAKKIDPYAPEEYIEPGEPGDKAYKGIRLKSSYKHGEDDFDLEVRDLVLEFNDVYEDLLGEEGTITQKVPRILAENDKTFEKSKVLSEISGIYQFRLKSNKHTEIHVLNDPKLQQASTKQQLTEQENQIPLQAMEKQPSQVEIIKEQNEASIQNLIQGGKNKKQAEEAKENESEQNLLDGFIEQRREVIVETIKQEPTTIQEQQENLLDEDVKPKQPIKEIPRPQSNRKDRVSTGGSLKKQSRSTSSSKKGTVSNSKVSEYSSNTQSISLYPIQDKKKIQFTIIGSEVKNPGNFKDFYITGNYNSRKGQRIRTAIKKIEGNCCIWNASNPPTAISQTVQTLTVKLHSKQYFSVNDELIGEGEIQILRSGDIKIPVYYKTKITGFVTVRVELA